MLCFPAIDGAVDHSGRDLRDPDVSERGQDAEPESGVVQLGGGGGVQASLPPVADRGGVVGEGDGGVVAGLGRGAHLLEELLDLLRGANVGHSADALLGRRVGPPHAGAEPVDATLDVGGELDANRRHPMIAGVSHARTPARAPRRAR